MTNRSGNELTERWLVIPPERLAAGTLQSLLEEFISREGTDYGFNEVSFDQQLKRGMAAIHKGEVVIVYNLETETTQLLLKKDCPEGIVMPAVNDASDCDQENASDG